MCHLSYPQLLSCAYSYKYLDVLWLPKRTQLWACFNTEPNRLYRRLRLFPSKLQEYTPPPFSRLSTQYHIDPLLACLLSLATSRRVCDYSGVQSSVTGILRMGDMNIHITWLTHVRTGPKKKKSRSGEAAGARLRVSFTLKLLLSQNFCNRPLMRFISFASDIGPAAAVPAGSAPAPLRCTQKVQCVYIRRVISDTLHCCHCYSYCTVDMVGLFSCRSIH